MMSIASSYTTRRGQLETYFDRTAVDLWARLTSEAPVNGIRATVRAGRNAMRDQLLGWLPDDLTGLRVLDAGCGTGALSVAAARRGAQVVAIDLSPTLIELARERLPHDLGAGSIEFHVGDMLAPELGHFDHVVAMDSLIHYRAEDIVRVIEGLTDRTRSSLMFTFAPRTIPLSIMHAVGRLLPRAGKAPAIEPVAERKIRQLIGSDPRLASWQPWGTHRVSTGFYISQALELIRS
jgi:magnesium-protoporphyrin O-methyltransferase